MAFNWKEFLVSSILPTIEAVGESQLEILLEKVKTADEANFALDLQGGYSLFKRLEVVANTTPTKIDDGIVATVLEAIQAVATKHGITLQ